MWYQCLNSIDLSYPNEQDGVSGKLRLVDKLFKVLFIYEIGLYITSKTTYLTMCNLFLSLIKFIVQWPLKIRELSSSL